MRVRNWNHVLTLHLVLAAVFCASPPALADYTVTGNLSYLHRDIDYRVGFIGTTTPRPIRFADVEIWAVTTPAPTQALTGKVATDENGFFSITVQGNVQQQIKVRCYAQATVTSGLLLEVRRNINQNTTFADPAGVIWYYESPAVNYLGQPSVPISATIQPTASEASVFNIWDAMVGGVQFVASVTGGFPSERLTAVWNSGLTGYQSYYAGPSSASNLTRKYMFIGSGGDDTVIYHQFGHFVADTYSKLDAPAASLDNRLPAYGDDNQDIRIAWAEGVAMFLGATIRQFKGDAAPATYVMTDGTNPIRSFEIGSLTSPPFSPPFAGLVNPPLASSKGSTNMLAVASALWNITNGTVLQRPFGEVWNVLVAMKSSTTPGLSVEQFWDTWFSPAVNNGFADEMRSGFSARGIEFFADSQESDDSTSGAPAPPRALLQLSGGAKVVVNEIRIGSGSSIELFNSGDTPADLSGWAIQASAGSAIAQFYLPPYALNPGAFVVLSGSAGINTNSTVYFGSALPWAVAGDGACALYDGSLTPRDFVRWGTSTAIPVSPFTGANPPSPAVGKTLGRSFAGTDTNAAGDWSEQAPSMGNFNTSGLEIHHTFFPAGDADYTSFNATARRTYLIETLNLTSGADPVLDLLGPDQTTVLASNDDLGPTRAARILWTAPATGTYFVFCRRYQGPLNLVRYGSYDLRIVESAAPIVAARPELLTVSKPGQGGNYQTIAGAIAVAGNGDTVQIVDSGTYTENLRITSKSITLKIAGGQNPVIDGGRSAPALILSNLKNARIDGIKILQGTVGVFLNRANATIVNTIVARAFRANSSVGDGLAIDAESTATVVNSTIVFNQRLGIWISKDTSATVTNTILRDNVTADLGSDIAPPGVPRLTIRNSLIGRQPTGWDFIGKFNNISGDPQFAAPTTDDYRVLPSSPVIDKGDAGSADLPLTDAGGGPRSLAGTGTGPAIPDIGAFEYYSPANLTSLAVFPQMAVGLSNERWEYRTSIIGINTGTQPVILNMLLTDNFGAPLEVSARGKKDTSFPFVLSPGATGRLETTASDTHPSLTSGYARFISTSTLQGSALFKVLDGETVLSEAGVGRSKVARNFVVYIDDVNNAWTGYAIANSGAEPANLVLTLRDKNGLTVSVNGPFELGTGKHIAEFAWQRFGTSPESFAGFEGSVECVSDREVAAVALRYDNMHQDEPRQVFSTVPVLVDEAASTLYFPQAADGGSYITNFVLVNPGAFPATARLELFGNDGSPLRFFFDGIEQSSVDVTLSAKGVARLITNGPDSAATRVGWVKVTSSQPIGGAAIFQTQGGGRITSEAGVADSPLSNHFTSWVSSLGETMSGVAICNPNNSQATITLVLKDTIGNVAISRQLFLPPNGHVASFFSGAGQWFPTGFDEFEGTLEVLSDLPVSAVGMRYDNPGLTVFGTIPVIIVP